MELERTVLPGIGVLYAFSTEDGQRAGVVAHRDGRRDLVLYDPEDPHRVDHAVTLRGSEPRTVAELLGLPVVVDQVPASARTASVRPVRAPVLESDDARAEEDRDPARKLAGRDPLPKRVRERAEEIAPRPGSAHRSVHG